MLPRFILITDLSATNADADVEQQVLRERGVECFLDTHFTSTSTSPADARAVLLLELINSVAVLHGSCSPVRKLELAYLCWYMGIPMVDLADLPVTRSITREWISANNVAEALGRPTSAGADILLQQPMRLLDIAHFATAPHCLEAPPVEHNFRMSVAHVSEHAEKFHRSDRDHYVMPSSMDDTFTAHSYAHGAAPQQRTAKLREQFRRLKSFALSCERRANALLGNSMKNPMVREQQHHVPPAEYKAPDTITTTG